VHPQEIDYNVNTLVELIDASGLEFLGFSNPHVWDLDRLIGKAPNLIERSQHLTERQRYRLIEVLDPQTISHYEFFLARPPIPKQTWEADADLLVAVPEPSPCIYGWKDSPNFFDYNYQLAKIGDAAWKFLRACDENQTKQQTVAQILQSVDASLEDVRSLQKQQVILLNKI
jgi:hypothetical protein